MPKNLGARLMGEARATSQEASIPQATMVGTAILPAYNAVAGMMTRLLTNAQMISDYAAAISGNANAMSIIDLRPNDNFCLSFFSDAVNTDTNLALLYGEEIHLDATQDGARMAWHIAATIDGLAGAASLLATDLAPTGTRCPITGYSSLNDFTLNNSIQVTGPGAGSGIRIWGDAGGYTKLLLVAGSNIGTAANLIRACYRPV